MPKLEWTQLLGSSDDSGRVATGTEGPGGAVVLSQIVVGQRLLIPRLNGIP
jgi:hypothetical protein